MDEKRNEFTKKLKEKSQKEEFDDEKVREIIEMEFDSLEEWKDVEMKKLKEDYRTKIYAINVSPDKTGKNSGNINNYNEDDEFN